MLYISELCEDCTYLTVANEIDYAWTSSMRVQYSLNKTEWICSLFKEWILEKSESRVNLEWTFVLFTHFGVTTGSLRDSEWSLRSLQNEWITQMLTPKFTLISLFSKIHSLKSEHIHSFLFREYMDFLSYICNQWMYSWSKVIITANYASSFEK